jgi:hypothetical protein
MAKAKSKADDDAALAESLGRARAEAEAWLDAKAEELKAIHPSIPLTWHRQNLMARSFAIGCSCLAVIMQVEGNK